MSIHQSVDCRVAMLLAMTLRCVLVLHLGIARDFNCYLSSRAQRGDPLLRFYGLSLMGLDCHVGMEPPCSDGKKSSVIRSAAWRSIAHTDDTVRVWTATSAVSRLAVTHTSIIVIESGA